MSGRPVKVRSMKEPFVVIWGGKREGLWNALEVNQRLNYLWAQGEHGARGFLIGHEPGGQKQ